MCWWMGKGRVFAFRVSLFRCGWVRGRRALGDGVCVHVHSVVTVHAVTISGSWSVCAVAGRFLRLLVDGAN